MCALQSPLVVGSSYMSEQSRFWTRILQTSTVGLPLDISPQGARLGFTTLPLSFSELQPWPTASLTYILSLDSDPGKPAQLLAGKAKKVDAHAVSFPNNSSTISGEDGVEPLQDGVDEEAEERMEESLSVSEVMDTTGTQGSVRTEKSKRHREMSEAVEAKEPEGSSGDEDISGRTGKGPSVGMRE